MHLTPFDFFLAFVLVVGLGLWGRREHHRLESDLARGVSSARMAGYRRVLAVQWPLVGLLGLHWVLRSRDVAMLQLRLPLDWRFGAGMLLAAAGTAFLWRQLRQVQTDPEARVEARKALENLRSLLPHTPAELDAFMRVSVTAGICEEVLYRGFLPWFLAHWMPLWAGMLVAGVIFGLAHVYQGVSGILKTGVIGILFGGLTLLAGSLVPAMILHVAVDALNGRLAYAALTIRDPAPELDGDGLGEEPGDEEPEGLEGPGVK